MTAGAGKRGVLPPAVTFLAGIVSGILLALGLSGKWKKNLGS